MLDIVTILILIDGFLQYNCNHPRNGEKKVTILILIDGFLQFDCNRILAVFKKESQSLF